MNYYRISNKSKLFKSYILFWVYTTLWKKCWTAYCPYSNPTLKLGAKISSICKLSAWIWPTIQRRIFPLLIIDLDMRWHYNTPFVLTVYLDSLTESPIKYCTVCGSAQLTSTLQGPNIYLSPDDPLWCIALTLHHGGSSWTGFSALRECRQCVKRDRRRPKVPHYVK